MLVHRLGVQGAGAQALGRCWARAGCAWGAQVAAERSRRWALGERALQARGARSRSGRRACGKRPGRARQGAAAGAGARGARGAGLAGRQARGLGPWAGLGLCTRCTRPIFDPF